MFIDKKQFRKLMKRYILVAIALLLAAAAFISFTFRSEISFAYHTERFLEDFSHDRTKVSNDMLQEKVDQYPNIMNIIALGSDSSVLAKANTRLLPEESLQYNRIKRNVWQIKGTPGVTISHIGTGTVGRWLHGVLDSGILDKFFEKSHSSQRYQGGEKISLFDNTKKYDCIIASNDQGERLLLIFDWQPVKNGALALLFGVIVVILIIMSAWLLIALWVYKDASKRQCAGIVWGLLALLAGVIGAATYLLYRVYHETCPNCFALQDKKHVFCVACGHKIAETCEKCNSILGAKDAHCSSCGKITEVDKK